MFQKLLPMVEINLGVRVLAVKRQAPIGLINFKVRKIPHACL